MAWRFRKRFQILPGVKLNISKSGHSATVGKKGASVNITKNGAYLNTGIPGTGLYRRDKISSNTMKKVEKADNYREPSCLFIIFSLFRGFCTVFFGVAVLGFIFNGKQYSTEEIIISFAGMIGFMVLLYIVLIYRYFAKRVKSKSIRNKPHIQGNENFNNNVQGGF